jgi:hypothetical protein
VSLFIGLLVGALAGAHAATWGMYKDAIHEGFSYRRYSRSIIVGAAVGLLLERWAALDVTTGAGLVVLFGMAYVAERTVVEIWKTFFREEDQSKYFIPMQFSMFGTPVKSRPVRWAVGAACLAIVGLVVVALDRLQGAALPLPRLVVALLVGSIGGWLTAVGGAWKDAPKEGFEPLKFFRSPLMTLAYAALLYPLTDRYLYLAMASLGFERATVETYKTFFFPHKPRGKFAGKPVTHPEMLTRRVRFAYLYAAIWVAVIASYATALTASRRGVVAGDAAPAAGAAY